MAQATRDVELAGNCLARMRTRGSPVPGPDADAGVAGTRPGRGGRRCLARMRSVAGNCPATPRHALRAPRPRHAGGSGSYPLGSTMMVTSGVIPDATLIATLYVPRDLSGSSSSILCLSTVIPRRARASAMSFEVMDP